MLRDQEKEAPDQSITSLQSYQDTKNFCGVGSWNKFLYSTGTPKFLSFFDFLKVEATLILVSTKFSPLPWRVSIFNYPHDFHMSVCFENTHLRTMKGN